MGLYNREYMRSPHLEPGRDSSNMLLILIAVNAVLYFFKIPDLALYMKGGFRLINIFQLVSAGFVHADFWHLFFNMWGLYVFGKLVTPYLSPERFVMLYLSGSISGNLLFLLVNLNSHAMLLGASGAVCAVMIAAATLEPNRKFMLIFLPFTPVKTSTLVICYTAMEVLMMLSGSNSNISHLAHLGGFVGGYVLMKIFFRSRLPWDPLRFAGKHQSRYAQDTASYQAPPPDPQAASGAAQNGPVTQKELDALLDKLSHTGINSLSPYELERLKKARRQMRGEE